MIPLRSADMGKNLLQLDTADMDSVSPVIDLSWMISNFKKIQCEMFCCMNCFHTAQ